MIGRAKDLRAGDTLVTSDGTAWTIARVEHVIEGIRLYIKEMPFPWLFASAELVAFTRPEPAAVIA